MFKFLPKIVALLRPAPVRTVTEADYQAAMREATAPCCPSWWYPPDPIVPYREWRQPLGTYRLEAPVHLN